MVELGSGMGTKDHTEPIEIEECIRNGEVVTIYLWEGGLLPFMEGMIKYEENISMHHFNSWKDKRMVINLMSFEITKDLIAKVGGFPI